MFTGKCTPYLPYPHMEGGGISDDDIVKIYDKGERKRGL
jgi:hypothetical protein